MLNLLRRFKKTNEDTFKSRVDRFWEWFASRSTHMLTEIDDGRCRDLQPETSEMVNKLFPRFGWVFGPGEKGARHSFTLTGEGVVERQILAQYWKSRAPSLPEWTFHASRQPSAEPPTWHIEMFGESFDPVALWCSVFIDEQSEKFDITAWHPLFEKLEEKNQYQILFIVLDELFGEFGTERWMGEIKITDSRLAESMPIAELRDFVLGEVARQGWEMLEAGEAVTLFEVKKQQDFPRGDMITWSSAIPPLVRAFFDGDGKPADLLEGSGTDFLFIAVPAETLPEGKELDERVRIEDAVNHALREAHSGRSIGGAMGFEGAYVDLFVFDGSASREIIKGKMRDLKLPQGSALYRFVDPGQLIFEIT